LADSTTGVGTGIRIVRALLLGVTLLVTLIMLLGAAVYFFGKDDNYRSALIWSADYFYDSQLEIDGDLSLEFGKEVRIAAVGIRLKANDGSYDLSIGKIDGRERFLSFFKTGSWWIPEISLSDVRVEIFEKETDHAYDWQRFYLPPVVIEKLRLSNLSLTYTDSKKQPYEIRLDHGSLDTEQDHGSIKLTAAGEVNGQPFDLEGTLGSLAQLRVISGDESKTYPIDFSLYSGTADASSAGSKGDSVVKFKGSIGRESRHSTILEAAYDVAVDELARIVSRELTPHGLGHLHGSVSIVDGDLDDRWEIKKFDLVASGTELYQLRIDMAVDDSKKDDQLRYHSEFGVPDPTAFGAELGIDLSRYSSIHSKGMLSGDQSQLSYRSKATLGNTEIDMELTASMKGDKPSIEGKVTIPELHLADIGLSRKLDAKIQSSAEAKTDSNLSLKSETDIARSQAIFSRDPLRVARLQQFNLDIDILVDKVIGAGYSVTKMVGHVDLKDGLLKVKPVQLVFEGGDTGLEVEVDVRDTPQISLKGSSKGLLLGSVLAEAAQDSKVRGNLVLDISSSGQSAHELASSLAGTARFGLENARLPKEYVQYLSADVFGWMLRKGKLSGDYAEIDCAIVDFEVSQGVATSNLLVVDGPNVFIQGSAVIDLGQETIDLVLKPKQKKKLFSKMSAVHIKGSLANPDVEALPLAAVSTGVVTAGAAVMLPVVVVPAKLMQELWGRRPDKDKSDRGCDSFLASHKAK